jgi:hypothetical protein
MGGFDFNSIIVKEVLGDATGGLGTLLTAKSEPLPDER